ncbi:alpha-1,6-mannosyltransferase [Perkinsus chesapeaki]|uniref:Alpha-1,6-mannosyltransferase n=1 Tax=Perkinsus chesapeaki TaxID=330153 RepID=A0A7J6LTD2_PERCH|nr:alpha-1,6-mannosyltransferase [Perkinsus chesapeaki]
MALEGRMRRAQALLLMGFIFTRDGGFNECTLHVMRYRTKHRTQGTPWPIQGWDMLLGAFHARQFVEGADTSSQLADIRGYREPGMKIAIVSICGYAANETVRVLSEENHALYSQIHGYTLHQFTGPEDIYPNTESNMSIHGRKPFFWKVNAVRNVMDSEDRPDWVMWMDCDAFYMDPLRTIDSVIRMDREELKVSEADNELTRTLKHIIHPQLQSQRGESIHLPEVELLIAVDSTGINNGVWMMRNSEWSKSFLTRWWQSSILQGAGREHNCSDQSTMQYELLYDRSTRQLLDSEGSEEWDRLDGPMWPPEWLYAEAAEVFKDKVHELMTTD